MRITDIDDCDIDIRKTRVTETNAGGLRHLVWYATYEDIETAIKTSVRGGSTIKIYGRYTASGLAGLQSTHVVFYAAPGYYRIGCHVFDWKNWNLIMKAVKAAKKAKSKPKPRKKAR